MTEQHKVTVFIYTPQASKRFLMLELLLLNVKWPFIILILLFCMIQNIQEINFIVIRWLFV